MAIASSAVLSLKAIVMACHGHTEWVVRADQQSVQGTAAADVGVFVNALAPEVVSMLTKHESRMAKGLRRCAVHKLMKWHCTKH